MLGTLRLPYRRPLFFLAAISVSATAAAAAGSLALGVSVVGAAATAAFLWLRNPTSSLGETYLGETYSDVRTGWGAVHGEAQRSRRHGRSFVLLAARGDARLARLLEPLLRIPDRVWVDDRVVYILLSDCNADDARGFLDRARSRQPDVFVASRWRLVSFPADAVTVGGMLDVLHSRPSLAVDNVGRPVKASRA